MGMIDNACHAVMRGDTAKSAEWGGQTFADVARAWNDDDDMPIVKVKMKDGREGSAPVDPHLVSKPKDRSMAVADIESAVRSAIVDARLDALDKPFDVASSQTPIPETEPAPAT